MTEIKKVFQEGRKLTLLIKGTDESFLNGIRRSIMKDVPVLAIEKVYIYRNSGVVFDEFLAHRLGMLPIKTDLKTYKKGDKIKFILEKDGPGMVYSRDIKCTDPKIEVADTKIPISLLKKDQGIKLEMDAIMDTGKEHSKYIPLIVGYRNLPKISVKEGNSKILKEVVDCCPVNVLEIKADKLVLQDNTQCTLCGKCESVGKSIGVEVETNNNSYLMFIEETGVITGKEGLVRASEELIVKVSELKEAIKAL